MRIAIFQVDLSVGGIQRSLVTLLRSEVFEGHDVDLFLFEKGGDYDYVSFPEYVNVIYLNRFPRFSRVAPFGLIRNLVATDVIKSHGHYDISIDYNGYAPETAAYALKIDASKKVIWDHNDYLARRNNDPKFRVMFWAFKSKFPLFDEVVAVSEGVKLSLQNLIRSDLPPVRVIQNIVDEREILQLAQVDVDFDVDPSCVNVICVGRLDKTKNPLGALGDFATALKTNDRLRLYFLGKGALADAVARETDRLGVGDKVFLLGAKPNPYPYIGKMDVLLLESLFEGQGVVLREAEALGLGLVFPRRLEKYNQNIYGCDCVAEALTRAVKRPDSALGGRLDAYNEGNRRAVSDLLESCR